MGSSLSIKLIGFHSSKSLKLQICVSICMHICTQMGHTLVFHHISSSRPYIVYRGILYSVSWLSNHLNLGPFWLLACKFVKRNKTKRCTLNSGSEMVEAKPASRKTRQYKLSRKGCAGWTYFERWIDWLINWWIDKKINWWIDKR